MADTTPRKPGLEEWYVEAVDDLALLREENAALTTERDEAERVLELLEAGGLVTAEKIAEARRITRNLTGADNAD